MIDSALIGGIATGLIKGWKRGGRGTRTAIGFASVGFLIAILAFLASDWGLIYPPAIGQFVGALFALPSGLIVLFFAFYEKERRETEVAVEIKGAEARFREHPDRPAAAWELASLKLQSYIDRNLSQIRWIFALILLVMTGGFAIVCAGIWEVWGNPQLIGPSIVAAGSGIIVQFIGATFLIVYRSTADQAKDYVSILERINAVGMSVQILDNLDPAQNEVRDRARIELAKGLLALYSKTDRNLSARRKLG